MRRMQIESLLKWLRFDFSSESVAWRGVAWLAWRIVFLDTIFHLLARSATKRSRHQPHTAIAIFS